MVTTSIATMCCLVLTTTITSAQPRKPTPPDVPQLDIYVPRGELGGRVALDMLAAVNARSAKLRACYASELQKTPKLAGKATVAMTVDVGGAVTSTKITGRTNVNQTLEACFVKELGAVVFSKGTRIASFTLPIEFSRGQAL